MSKLKVIIGLGVAALGLTLLGDAKKASASTVPATPEPPATPPAPAKKPAGKPKRKASALTESDAAAAAAKFTPEQCADKLAQVWPTIEGGRASESVLTQAWAWAQRAKKSTDAEIQKIASEHATGIDEQLKKMSYRGDETPSDR